MNTAIQKVQPIIIFDKIAPVKNVQDIPRSEPAYTVAEGQTMEYFVQMDGRTYKVHTDEKGNPVKLSRYNEKYKMYVSISFSDMENENGEQTLISMLKDCYKRRVMGSMIA